MKDWNLIIRFLLIASATPTVEPVQVGIGNEDSDCHRSVPRLNANSSTFQLSAKLMEDKCRMILPSTNYH